MVVRYKQVLSDYEYLREKGRIDMKSLKDSRILVLESETEWIVNPPHNISSLDIPCRNYPKSQWTIEEAIKDFREKEINITS